MEHLLSSLKIGNTTVRNRIFSTGHQTVLVDNGVPNDALIAYHEARAKGGAGLIITEIAAVHETAFFSTHTIEGYLDACIPGYRQLADTVHRHGTRVFGQLFHPGREVYGGLADGRRAIAYAPSDTPAERYLLTPQPMSVRLITEVIEGYAATAVRMQTAGLDGAEIVASHGYLPAQFLNPRVNTRDDQYGGSTAGRLRFLREVIAAVRTSVGDGFVLGLRISGDEMTHDGLTPNEVLATIEALESDGGLDYFNVIAGASSTSAGAIHIVPPMRIEPGYVAGFAAEVKSMVARPVLVAGRINDPRIAERIIESGNGDMCGMTRALICDPTMPSKVSEDRLEDIRACIACNQACIGHMQIDAPISCIQHPETGRELIYGHRDIARRKKRVMVVGGGPAGMKAAAVAAERGHDVSLYERERHCGGQTLLAQLLPGRAEFGGLSTNLQREMELAGVNVFNQCEVDREVAESAAPDVVILATGAKSRSRPELEGIEDAHVFDAWEVLQRQANLGASVVIADSWGDWTGLGLAEALATEGHRVRYLTTCPTPGQAIQSYLRDQWVGELHKLGVEISTYMRLVGADSDTAFAQHTVTGEFLQYDETDSIVLAHGVAREAVLEEALAVLGIPVHLVGDCVTPRTAEEAVFDGLAVANKI